jgi:hypothetical protein
MSDDKRVYLGDGLYAFYDGHSVWLTTPRPDGEHRVCLEPDVIRAFIAYLQAEINYP